MSLAHRMKVCLLGAGTSGKTSLIRSLMEMAPSLTHIDERTIGIDRYEWTIFDADSHPHDVTVWDFAGQDVYQSAHTLFFSQRTLYFLCVDLAVYSQALLDHAKEPIALNRDAKTQRFVQSHVLRWAGMIIARQPDAVIVVVGTKSDLLDKMEIDRVSVDLHLRIESWFKNHYYELKGDERPHVPVIKTSLRNFLKNKMIVVNVKTDEAVREARASIEACLLSVTTTGISMTPMHSMVLDGIKQSFLDLNRIIVDVASFKDLLVQHCEGLTRVECEQVLEGLHDLGDLLWFRQGHNAILDPELVLDLVRELVNHTHANRDGVQYDAIRSRGEVRHDFLMGQPHWQALAQTHIDNVLLFKRLMQIYGLAYPLGPDGMTATSDLIVPTYWKLNKQEQLVLQSTGEALPHRGFWQYDIPIDVSEIIFDQFMVRSHSKHLTRCVTSTETTTYVQSTKSGVVDARVYHEMGIGKTDRIRIDVAATSDALCWASVQLFVSAMEIVLESYPGLNNVGRHILYRDSASAGQQKTNGEPPEYPFRSFEVVLAMKALQDQRIFAMGGGYARQERPWLPPDLDWFEKKAWHEPDELESCLVNLLSAAEEAKIAKQAKQAKQAKIAKRQLTDPVHLHLQLTTANGISDCLNAWCEWELCHGQIVKDSGATRRNQSSKSIRWSTQFPIATVKSLAALQECTLRVKMKRPGHLPFISKSIGRGAIELKPYVSTDAANHVNLTVPLTDAASVTCTLSILS